VTGVCRHRACDRAALAANGQLCHRHACDPAATPITPITGDADPVTARELAEHLDRLVSLFGADALHRHGVYDAALRDAATLLDRWDAAGRRATATRIAPPARHRLGGAVPSQQGTLQVDRIA